MTHAHADAALRWYMTQPAVRNRVDSCATCTPDIAARAAVMLHRWQHHDAKRLPRQAQPRTYEDRYRRQLRKRVADVHAITVRAIERELRKVGPAIDKRAARTDNATDDVRRLLKVITSVERAVIKSSPVDEAAVVKLGEQLSLFTTKAVDRQLASVIGIDVTKNVATSLELVESWVASNVELITSIDVRYFDELRDVITDTVRSGKSTQSLSDAIVERYGVAQSRAEIIARDQVGTLNAEITQARQTDLGIEEYTWSSSNDERVRPSHRDLNGTVRKWANPHPTEGHPGTAILCLPGDAQIALAEQPLVAYRRRYSCELTELITETGETVCCTPNHPVLTSVGWVAAERVDVGDYVVRQRHQRSGRLDQNDQDREPTAEECFSALAAVGVTRTHGGAAAQFHGDGTVDQDVDIVDIDWSLPDDFVAMFSQEACELFLAMSDHPSLRARHLEFAFVRYGLPANRSVRGFCQALALLSACAPHPDEHRVAAIAWLDSTASKMARDGGPLDAVALCKRLHALASDVATHHLVGVELLRVVRRAVGPHIGRAPSAEAFADRIRVAAKDAGDIGDGLAGQYELVRVVEKRRRIHAGHVFNLETSVGWYVANGVVHHNCRCVPIAKL